MTQSVIHSAISITYLGYPHGAWVALYPALFLSAWLSYVNSRLCMIFKISSCPGFLLVQALLLSITTTVKMILTNFMGPKPKPFNQRNDIFVSAFCSFLFLSSSSIPSPFYLKGHFLILVLLCPFHSLLFSLTRLIFALSQPRFAILNLSLP